jgi:alpha-amylase
MSPKSNPISARLADVPADKAFWCCDNHVLRNLDELAAALQGMSDQTYGYHVNGEKNDFTKWVRDVIGDATLAKNLDKTADRASAAHAVTARLARLRAKK